MSTQNQAADLPFVEYLDNPKLKKFVKRIAPGGYLFRQGEYGNTMFIIADGTVWLTAERDNQEHVVAVLERGQFLGEKAVMGTKSHQRFFSAKAKTHALVIELGYDDMDMVHATMPELWVDMLRRMFKIAADRLDRSNYLVRLLRSSDNVERLVHLLVYLSHTSGRKVSEGIEFVLSPHSIPFHIDMNPEQISACIVELQKRKLLKHVLNDYYLIRDEKALLAAIPALREHLESVMYRVGGEAPQRRFGIFRRK